MQRNDTVERVRERIDIVEVVGQHVQLRKAGRNFKGLCPFHQEKTPSFIVFPETQTFHCFGCGAGGDVFNFVMQIERVDFREALRDLAEKAGVPIEEAPRRPSAEETERHARLYDLNARAASWFAHVLWQSSAGQPGRELLERRGVDRATAERFQLGFAPDRWDALLTQFARRGVPVADLVAAGLAMPRDDGSGYDRFRNRLMFPIRDRDGRVVGFGGRALGDAQPKYLNSPQTAIFDKGANLYALDLAQDAIRRTRQVVVVEGYMDAIAAHQHGFENVVASMGTALTEAQIGLIRRGVDRIVLALDADAAGQSATLRGLDALRDHLGEVDTDRPILDGPRLLGFERTLKTDIRIARLPAGLDPDDLIRRDPETWRQAIEHPVSLLDFYVDAIVPETPPADPREKSAIVARIAPVLRSIDDAVVRDHYVKEVANRLRVSEQRVLSPGASRVVRAGGVAARPGKRPVDYEEHLFALLLRYPEMLWSLIPEVPAQDVLDARRRSILAALQAVPPRELRQAIDALPEELRGHADDLLARTEGHPAGHPGKIRKEAEDTLRALRRARHDLRWRQLSEELSAARQEGDAEAEKHVRGLIRQLMARYPEFYPDPSPLFPDTRTAAK